MRFRILAGGIGATAVLLAGLAPVPSPAGEVPARTPKPTVQTQAVMPAVPMPLASPPTQERPKPAVIDPKKYDKNKGPNQTKRAVLTYDDCPNDLKSLNAVLTYARDNKVGLVLAPTGDCHATFKKKYKIDLGAHIRSYGQHTINHTRTHPNLTKRKPANIRWQLTGEVKADYGRPPYGARNKKVDGAYAAVGMRVWLWNVDSRDWENGGKPQGQVVKYVVTHTTAGSTVLMHMQHAGFNPNAIRAIEAGLRTGPKKVLLCRPFRGWDNPANGPVLPAPAKLGNYALPC